MRLRHFVLAALLAATPVSARAEIVVLQDPDKWIEEALADISAGKTDEFARNFLKIIDKPRMFDSFAGNLRVLGRIAPPVFIEKISDAKYGPALRQVMYVGLYNQTDYMYFKFTLKKNRGGWLISNFEFKSEPGDLFPAGWGPP